MRIACPSRSAVNQMSAPSSAGVTAYLIAFSISGAILAASALTGKITDPREYVS